MNISSVNILKVVLVLTIFILNTSTFELTNHEKINTKRIRKNNENLCPDEYKLCSCDYINLSNNLNNNAKTNGISISINCQPTQPFNSEDIKLNKNAQKFKKPQISLTRIPRILANSSSARFKYLKQIVHIDLSETDITEIETEAFQVN